VIKDFGAKKHHDLLFGDFDGDGKEELVSGIRWVKLYSCPALTSHGF